MENNTNPNKKKLFILIGILAVIVIIVIVIASQGTKKANPAPVASPDNSGAAANVSETNATGTASPAPAAPAVTLPAGTRVEAPGASLITKDNKVVNAQGVELKNNIVPGAVEAPQETGPIAVSQVANSAIKIEASASGFKPAQFTVKAGQPVTLSITGTDQWAHVFAFRDAALSSIAVGIGGIETRAITFKAPAKAGEYEYYCNVPGHPARGEVGKMIVQ